MLIIIIPTFEAESHLASLLKACQPDRTIVADGGSQDATLSIAIENGAVTTLGSKGRGPQLRLGAHLATLSSSPDDWFLFLHADSQLPDNWRSIVEAAMDEGDPCYFRFRAAQAGWRARFMDQMVALRCWALGLPYGDQGLLISRALYEEVGGYAPIPLFEDVDMVERIKKSARLRALPAALTTDVSAHWRDGLWRRGLRNLRLLWRYKRGTDIEALLDEYRT